MKRKFLYVKIFYLLFSFISLNLFGQTFYWDSPKAITSVNSQFPVVISDDSNNFLFFEEVASKSEIYLSVQIKDKSSFEWGSPKRFAGPFKYSGEVPDIYSVAISDSGVIAVAVLVSDTSVGIFVSDDGGQTFSFSELPHQVQPIVGPRIYSTSSNGFVLFAALGENESFKLMWAKSANGHRWSSLSIFEPTENFTNPFAPYLCKIPGGGDLVVFQAQHQYLHNGESRRSYQLYSTCSVDNLSSWSLPLMVTDEKSLLATSDGINTNYNNQRPILYSNDSKIFLSWERTFYASESSHIWFMELSKNGVASGGLEEITNSGSAHRPVFFEYNSNICLSWFDNRRGNDSIYMAIKNGFLWEENTLYAEKKSAFFVYPLINAENQLSFIWQQKVGRKNVSNLYSLMPDMIVNSPKISPKNFKDGKKNTSEKIFAKVVLPEDSSGIAGFSWLWTKNEFDEPPEEFMNLPTENTISCIAQDDGVYYLKVRATDYAGNWSDSVSVKYWRDLTPPKKPIINNFDFDEYGFAKSNSVFFEWKGDDSDDDIVGFSWNLVKVSELDNSLIETPRYPLSLLPQEVEKKVQKIYDSQDKFYKNAENPPRFNKGNKLSTSYKNYRNGVYVFSVCAIDEVGNIGEKTSLLVLLNKYKPFTLISGINSKKDEFGALSISIYGQDFKYDGSINEIYIDRDGLLPYDRVLSRRNGDYSVVSNSLITGIKLQDLDVGNYGIFLNHSFRGVYPKNLDLKLNRFIIDESGTIKIEKPYKIVSDWIVTDSDTKFNIQVIDWLLILIMAFVILGSFISIRGLAVVARESVIIKGEVQALLTGDVMPMLQKEKTKGIQKKGIGLKIKLVGFTAMLVLMIVLMVSVPLGVNMIKTQERTLATGLSNRVNVLMESLSSGVRSYLPTGLDNILELNYLPLQTDSFEEASYATIIGQPANKNNTNLNYVWASNDKDILKKIDTAQWSYGVSRLLPDDIGSKIALDSQKLEDIAKNSVGELALKIRELTIKGSELARANDEESINERNKINDEVRVLNEDITKLLNKISSEGSGAYPEFDNNKLDKKNTKYIFYKPVLYRQGGDDNFVHAIILMEISTDNLIAEVSSAQKTILLTSIFIALCAIALGIIGSYLLASVIIKPIKNLVLHVNKIGETKDKKLLKDFSIHVKTKDEIGTLGDAVNQMTQGLVKAAEDEEKALEQSKMALDGKAVQQTFLPLLINKNGGKETTAELKEQFVHFYGYYEGADAVSGDYFDYKKLDEKYYAIIKCDASGHGVPAALIMTVVATLFRKYFENWSIKTHGTNLSKLVVQINDFIESLGVKGKFATLMICLFDTVSGDVYMCNAGDNIVHIFDSATQKEKVLTLQESPAAGPLPSFMVDMKGGFKVEKTKLNSGDILFLYTDGIEESTRFFRDSKYQIIPCDYTNFEGQDNHFNHKIGQKSEQLEADRVKLIIESVLNKKSFVLEKYHNPIKDEELVFDFSKCEGTIEESILALVSVEKIFRIYKTPTAKGVVITNEKGDVVIQGDGIKVDRKIDLFLKKTFNRYDYYCSGLVDMNEINYVYYTGVNEDPQADDLTLLAVKKN